MLFDGPRAALRDLAIRLADRPGAILPLHALADGQQEYRLEGLVEERAISTNTAAAGGNATLKAMS